MSQLLLITMLLLCSIIGLSLVNFITNRRLKKFHSGADALQGVSILKATFFVCIGLLISEVGTAGKEVLNFQTLNPVGGLALFLAGYVSLFFSLALLIALICMWFSRLVFSVFTKGKNIYESAVNSEFANVVMFAGIVICITLVVKPGLSDLLLQAIRYSSTPIFH
jgi:hypothetical protein